ncbi:hypothetical protein [Sulfitobacter sp. S190]|uniref:hypothetical protein n=1 Tax=Sulfitobacter sp. S190 TaxID=2867022 RepID=UPI0021A777E1|nr:hypothetical protein [Sulfitobacter sp. S190]UWR21190.1 hypothetical protein K3756_10705 [Sulfitobacter sp. S190]
MKDFKKQFVTHTATATCVLGVTVCGPLLAQDSNACPVDGCAIEIASATQTDGELSLEINANFDPDISKNHFHIWWGELYDVKQVSNNAETVHNVAQGDWHPTDAYPSYTTTGVTSLSQRGDASSLCISAADRNHDIIDPGALHCVDVSAHF